MMHVRLGCDWSLGRGTLHAVDAALFRLLEGVERHGTLRGAARELGLSYRHAWGLTVKWAERFGESLVELERGKGARLTACGENLLRAERRVNARLTTHLAQLSDEIAQMLSEKANSGQDSRLVVHASHDLALARLRDALVKKRGLQLDLQFHGSLDSLASLARSNCDLAGFHVPEQPSVQVAAALRPLLNPRTHRLVRFVMREQGLIVAHGNPKRIFTLADLPRNRLRIVNRQRGSGTRLAFDQLLAEARIDARRIAGYEVEEFTHLAVAATIASGRADAGFGVRAAAAEHHLGFVPLARETYLFAFHPRLAESARFQEFVELLRGARVARTIAKLPGYDAARAGTVCTVEEALPWLDAPARHPSRHRSVA